MKDAGGPQKEFGLVTFVGPAEPKPFAAALHLPDFVPGKADRRALGLETTAAEQFQAGDGAEPEIVFDAGFPFGHRFARIDDQHMALGSAEINGCRKPGQAAANDDHVKATTERRRPGAKQGSRHGRGILLGLAGRALWRS